MTYASHRSDPEIAQILELETVPPVDTTRWLPRRKAQVVAAVQAGLLTIDEVCTLYRLSIEEFLSWQSAVREYGVSGLRVSRSRARPRRSRFASLDSVPRMVAGHA